ncbi:MAG: T9SS type A sorting domain-containing protein [Marinilabiliaceae bacterium]|nr:T9SS type A sorting domain-containing protein [Marinilabiliaceae bacterium]
MKNKIFTRLFVLSTMALLLSNLDLLAQNTDPGTGWDNLIISSDVVIEEDFTTYEHLHSREHTNQGNSKDVFDEGTFEWIWGHRNQVKDIPFINYLGSATFTFDTCAFAPTWGVAYSLNSDGTPRDPDPTTEGVSNGFVEVSRQGYGDTRGYFMIDLRQLPYVEAIQYSHSSSGGVRRGFALLFSLNDSLTWDTLRYQPGDAWNTSYTKSPADFPGDPYIMTKKMNEYNCQVSGNGMLWEDQIKASNVMLMFISNPTSEQAVRIHDLKVYGGDAPTGINDVLSGGLTVTSVNDQIVVSEPAFIEVFSCDGAVVKNAKVDDVMSTSDLADGIYVVKASSASKTTTIKILKK